MYQPGTEELTQTHFTPITTHTARIPRITAADAKELADAYAGSTIIGQIVALIGYEQKMFKVFFFKQKTAYEF